MTTEARRMAFFLPNIFTALNMACGFASIIAAWKGDFYKASMLLFLGSIFDMVDGRLARLTGTQSSFGEQFDSLSDLVSFCIAPAFLVYNVFFSDMGRVGATVSFLFLLGGALRLARFNANIDKVSSNYFQGLPTPSAALSVVGVVLWGQINPIIYEWDIIPAIYVAFHSILMISNVPFISFKNSQWVKTHKKAVLVLIFTLLILLALKEELMIGLITSAYIWSCLVYFIIHRKNLSDVFDWKSDTDE